MNKLFIVSGTSGSEQRKALRPVIENEVISFTTRPIRETEVEGEDYYFITTSEFEKLHAADEIIEVTNVRGHFYGVTRAEFSNKLNRKTALWFANYQGMKQIKKHYRNCSTLYIYRDKALCIRNNQDAYEADNLYYYDHVLVHKFGESSQLIEDIKDILYEL